MTHVIEPTTMIASRPALTTDVSLALVFNPDQPIGLTTIVARPAPAPCDHAGYLALLDAALARLHAYRDGYVEAVAEDAGGDGRATWATATG